MKFLPVTKDRQRKATMEKSLETTEKDEVIGPALAAALPIESMKQTLALFAVALPEVKRTFAARRNSVAQRDKYLTLLETTIRDFWAGLTRRHQRLGLEPGDLAHYRMPSDRQGLNITRKEEWIHIGKELIQGEE